MNDFTPVSDSAQTVVANDGVSANSQAMNVGFIGLRRMGAGMAANLLKAGHQVLFIIAHRRRRRN